MIALYCPVINEFPSRVDMKLFCRAVVSCNMNSCRYKQNKTNTNDLYKKFQSIIVFCKVLQVRTLIIIGLFFFDGVVSFLVVHSVLQRYDYAFLFTVIPWASDNSNSNIGINCFNICVMIHICVNSLPVCIPFVYAPLELSGMLSIMMPYMPMSAV